MINEKTVQSFSQGEFRHLMQDWKDSDFMGYNVICVFNTYEKVINAPTNALKLFFNDVNNEQLSLIEKYVFNKSSFLYNLYVKYRQQYNH